MTDLDQEIAQLLEEIENSSVSSSFPSRQRPSRLNFNAAPVQPRMSRPRSTSSPQPINRQMFAPRQITPIQTESSTTYTRPWLDGFKEFRKPTNNPWSQFIATKAGRPYGNHLLNAAEAAELYVGGGGEYELKDPVKATKQRQQRRARKARSQF